MILGVEKHGGTHAILPFLAHENIIVHTALAAGPECFVLCQFRIGYGFITQVAVDFHYSKTRSKSKYLSLRIFYSRQIKNSLLDRFGHATFSEGRSNNQPAVCNIFAMT